MVTNVVVALDDSDANNRLLHRAVNSLCRGGDFRLHLVTVRAPVSVATIAPPAPMATAAAMTAMASTITGQMKADEVACKRRLNAASLKCIAMGIKREEITLHCLPASGGASGVAESLVTCVNKTLPNVVAVIGNRGLGSWKRSMMSVIGLGSVGDYCLQHMTCPVIICKRPAPSKPSEAVAAAEAVAARDAEPDVENETPSASQAAAILESEMKDLDLNAPLRFCVCADGSDFATAALTWALSHLITPEVQLHIISVAPPVPLPFCEEMVPAAATMVARQYEDDCKGALQLAENTCAEAVDLAIKSGVSKDQIFWKALRPEGGASDVAASIVHYVDSNHLDLCVVGRHGYSAFKRGLRSLIGLGSVSEHLVHNLSTAVAVVKLNSETLDHEKST